MTCVAWDGKTLAADKRLITSGGLIRTVTKIERHGPALLAIVGSFDTASEMREWWKSGADPSKFPVKARDDSAELIVIHMSKKIETFCTGPYPLTIESEKCAFGSGRDFAEAAMYLGETAARAVNMACLFMADCGNGIDTLNFR